MPATKAMLLPTRAACIGTLLMMAAMPAAAQSLEDIFRPLVAEANLGAGYAQMLNLAATPDIGAAHFEIDHGGDRPTIDIFRLPYQSRWLALSQDSDLYWRVSGDYLQQKEDLDVGGGSIASKWSAYSLTGGLLAKIRLGNGFTLAPALDLGVARLDNRADYDGTANLLKPFFDELLFNWRTNAWLVTPSVQLGWNRIDEARRISISGHVARSWISSFGESDRVLEFNETANIYSLRAEHAAPTDMQLAGRPLDWVIYGGYAGFFGPNRDVLGFTSVAEVGVGMETPLVTDQKRPDRARLGASYLFGEHVRGWTISLSLQY